MHLVQTMRLFIYDLSIKGSLYVYCILYICSILEIQVPRMFRYISFSAIQANFIAQITKLFRQGFSKTFILLLFKSRV